MGDRDVLHVSIDALVRSLDNKHLWDDILLGTQGLLYRRPDNGEADRTLRYTGHDVGVAVIDSGIKDSGDLRGIDFFDFTNRVQPGKPGGQYDDYGHGTHVSGLIGSVGDWSSGQYSGMAPDCHFIVLKVLDKNGAGYTSDLIDAINFAVANRQQRHIDVINLSLGHPIYEPAASDPLVQAVERAVAKGIVVVVAAGNFGGDPRTHEVGYGGITSPGNAPSAITVGAVDTKQTVTRDDDTVAWYSSRGPTWYDGFQKPDIVAPGSQLVSDISPKSTLYLTYPAGLLFVGDKPFMRLSGTSMSTGVVSGVVALMLDANRANHHSAALTPNTVKAILEYTALPIRGFDTLTQGAGSLNALGAVELAAAIDPQAAVKTWWLSTGVNPWTTVGNETLAWGQRVIWGDRVIWGNQIYTNDPAWALRVVWGDRVIWGDRVVWGNSTVWDDGNPAVWGSRVIWGNSLIGQNDGMTVTWGSLTGDVTADRVVWGDLGGLSIAPLSMSWSNLERANGDLVAQ
jgi:serine protease AprX